MLLAHNMVEIAHSVGRELLIKREREALDRRLGGWPWAWRTGVYLNGRETSVTT